MAESGCLKDVKCQNLEVEGNTDLSSSTLTLSFKTLSDWETILVKEKITEKVNKLYIRLFFITYI